MTFGKAVETCFKKYCVFRGRARRAEYWYFMLFIFLVNFGLSFWMQMKMMPALLGEGPGRVTDPTELFSYGGVPMIVSLVFSLATLLPILSVWTRRLHDIGRSGWWILAYYLLDVLCLVAVGASAAGSFAAGGMKLALLLMVVGLGMLAISVVMLVWLCTADTVGPNKYGPDPKECDSEAEVVDVPFTVEPEAPSDEEGR